MTQEIEQQTSQLIAVLREGISIVQMVIFKELRTLYSEKHADKDVVFRSMLIGAVINKLFGMVNPEERFLRFNEENKGIIEQELLGFAQEQHMLCRYVTDALRVQVLCDNQEEVNSSNILIQAEELGILRLDREIPLPSTFMTRMRNLGEEHGLTIAPVQITPEQDRIVH